MLKNICTVTCPCNTSMLDEAPFKVARKRPFVRWIGFQLSVKRLTKDPYLLGKNIYVSSIVCQDGRRKFDRVLFSNGVKINSRNSEIVKTTNESRIIVFFIIYF